MSGDVDENEGLEDFAAVGRIVHGLQVAKIFAGLVGRRAGVGAGAALAIALAASVFVRRTAAAWKTHLQSLFWGVQFGNTRKQKEMVSDGQK